MKYDFEAWTESLEIEIVVNEVRNRFLSVFGYEITHDNSKDSIRTRSPSFKGYEFVMDNLARNTKSIFTEQPECQKLPEGCS